MAENWQLDQFLASIQNRAFVTARLATGNADEALDIVQDSMLKLVKSYANYPQAEWPALFQRVLQNTIRDWYRRQKVRRILFWWQQQDAADDQAELIEPGENGTTPMDALINGEINAQVEVALRHLPERQRQAFLLRAWWEHSTEETAAIMGCSTGSVKTHYSRALKALQLQLDNLAVSAS
ncbi:RNA polymerase sigma factor [Halioxenophilus sp. WMMB6]|uniref:RNA polymerase sigma factor n=1 Tax=Halioxenophilus sp. WMMB6 TaxID=3073815 RepID=UPI00295E4E48|nr:RNA polymerase sigma factor [Halioxenophilus sp. WMMB6]